MTYTLRERTVEQKTDISTREGLTRLLKQTVLKLKTRGDREIEELKVPPNEEDYETEVRAYVDNVNDIITEEWRIRGRGHLPRASYPWETQTHPGTYGELITHVETDVGEMKFF